jgi:hypothetical protein
MEIDLYPNNMNREDGCFLSRPWTLLIHVIKLRKEKILSRTYFLLILPSFLFLQMGRFLFLSCPGLPSLCPKK